MCGIVSYMSETTTYRKDYENMLRDLLIVDTVRGFDSTGLMYEDATHTRTLKKAMPGYDFVQLRQAQRALSDYYRGHYMVGHNRAATVGKVGEDTAHPFMFENVTGVHNGTLTGNYRGLSRLNHTVDSEYLLSGLDEAKSS